MFGIFRSWIGSLEHTVNTKSLISTPYHSVDDNYAYENGKKFNPVCVKEKCKVFKSVTSEL